VRLQGTYSPADPAVKRFSMAVRPTEVRVRSEESKAASRDGVRTLMGRVFDPSGSPIAGVHLVYENDRGTFTCATDRLGVFRVKRLPTHQLLMRIGKKGFQPASALITPEAREVEITLQEQDISSN
jgi:hypothetical protein